MTYKHRDIVIAYMDGKTIQVAEDKGRWQDLKPFNPKNGIINYFWDDGEYRIKPEPKKYRVALFKNGMTTTSDTFYDSLSIEEDEGFSKWLTDWVEYEV